MARTDRFHRDNVPSARQLRTRQTHAETVLWSALRSRGLAGLKFRRQHPIGPFVADFCCPDRRLVVEIDGNVHDSQIEPDAEREALLLAAGYRVLRIRNDAVVADLANVLTQIQSAASESMRVLPGERSRTSGW